MKTIIRFLACSLALAACAIRPAGSGDDGNGGGSNPNPNPNPQPKSCASDADCDNAPSACDFGTCRSGTCAYASSCGANETCNEQAGTCDMSNTLPTTHGISCFVTNDGNLHVTVSGKLTDAIYGGTLTSPTHISIATDADGSTWNTTTLTTAYQIALDANETSLGGVLSEEIVIPQNQAQRFTLLAWPSSGTALRFDLSKWNVGGDSCARISDGFGPNGADDGFVIGRPPLCPNACDDGNSSTADSCQSDGCHHGTGTTNTGNGNLACVEQGTQTYVTISNGILAHVFDLNGATPSSIRFGYGGTDSEAWVSDSTSYVLTMPNTVSGFNLVVRDTGGNDHWFDVTQFNASGTCSVGTGEFRHAAGSNTGSATVTCSESGSNTLVTIPSGVLAHVLDAFNGASPSSIGFGYGGTQALTWQSDSVSYTLTMPNTVSNFTFAVWDTNGHEHWARVSDYAASGTCAIGTNEFLHSTTTNASNGTISCSLTSTDWTITISNGILAHLSNGQTVNPSSNWKMEYGSASTNYSLPYTTGRTILGWQGDTATYTFTLSSSDNAFSPALTDGTNVYWLDLNEYTYSNCFITGGHIWH